MTQKTSQKIASDLAKVVKGDVFTDILHRAAYSTDASIYQIVPSVVVVPRDIDDGRKGICEPGVVPDDLNNQLAEYGRPSN